MSYVETLLGQARPQSIRELGVRAEGSSYNASPADWRDEVLYFLLVDRFSDGQEDTRPLLNREDVTSARSNASGNGSWSWQKWADSGAYRWQGGTLKGVASKLDYLKGLGMTAIWLSPVFKQRTHLDSYHGYGIQDFLDVDPRFGLRADLVELVTTAHEKGFRIILDIIFNHSGCNWLYPEGTPGGIYEAQYKASGQHPFGTWRGEGGQSIAHVQDASEGVWPLELQHPDCYTRAGTGDLGKGHHGDEQAEHKRSDFLDLRDFHLEGTALLTDLALCYKYWIALTDCDGFRIDTLKHVTAEQARSFCGSIKEFAHRLGKRNFIMLGEVAGGEHIQDYYLDVLDLNLDAVLDIGEMRPTLSAVAKGIMSPEFYFNGFSAGDRGMGSHRNLGKRHVSILDDHDHVFSDRIRFSSETASPHQVVAGVALQMFTLGIPCVYYGTEQALAGPEPGERRWLPDWKQSDRYLREAMFGPVHPRKSGAEGLNQVDTELPGFGPFGTAGHHCFDADHPVYKRIAALTEARSRYPALRYGRQYLRAISFLGKPFSVYGPGELIAWSRILDDEELLCVLNANGLEDRGGYVSVDAAMNGKPSASFTVVLNTAEVAGGATSHPVGSTLAVHRTADGRAFVELMNLAPSEIVVLANYP